MAILAGTHGMCVCACAWCLGVLLWDIIVQYLMYSSILKIVIIIFMI